MQLTLDLPDESATQRLGEDLALALKPGDVLALSGDLGAGKSTLARALIRALADDAELEVPSPTFTLVQAYGGRLPVAHFDFYRLSGPDELDELGFHDALEDGIAIVEWPERMEGHLPESRIRLELHHHDGGRRARVTAGGRQAERIGRSLLIRDFLETRGFPAQTRRYLTGDASVRAYEYLPRPDGSRLILMDWPKPPAGPPVHEGKPYAQVAHIAQDALPFIALSQALSAKGFAVPDVLEADCENGILLLNDLGSEGIVTAQGSPVEERYQEAVLVLAMLHAEPFPADIRVDSPGMAGQIHHIPCFDRLPMMMEVRLLLDWYLPWKTGRDATEDERETYQEVWNRILDGMDGGERNLLLRDFHSPNIIWRPQNQGCQRIGILDFQDSMIGPTAYDVASLVQDARITVPSDMGERLLAAYLEMRRPQPGFDAARFRADFAIMAAQRACKLAGLWVRLMQRDGKPVYMQHMPRTLDYLRMSLSHPSLVPLRDWFAKARIGILES